MKPPFRADHVGSLLRPATLAAARAAYRRDELTADQLRGAEDHAIRAVVARQEATGLQSITDGELRRDYWHIDFLRQLDGVTIAENPGPRFGGTEEQPPIATVTGRIA
jgi:5-methyltetrahydropteroyltriglutamate--homocysteine methyltransferase